MFICLTIYIVFSYFLCLMYFEQYTLFLCLTVWLL
nr:MAG TPA: hypothetical protein [Caudoviricetes sp.]